MQVPLSRPQMAAMKALQPGHTVCIPWGRGGGKSKFHRLFWYRLVMEWDGRRIPGAPRRGVRIVLIMPTLEQARKVHEGPMLAELSDEWAFLGGRLNRQTWCVTFPGGSTIQWVTAERAKHTRGIRCDVVSIDECDDIPTETYDAIVGPWLSEPWSLGLKLLGGTPTRGRYGLLYRTHARGSGLLTDNDGNAFTDHASFHATCYDFPSKWISAAEIERNRKSSPAELFSREWMCDFDAAEGLVYPDFSEDFHVRDPHPDTVWQQVIVGADWGYSDPAALLVLGIAGGGRDVTVHLLRETYVTGKTDSQIAEEARRIEVMYPRAKWYGDPSRPQTIASLKREAGINIIAADNAIDDGIATVLDTLLIRTDDQERSWSQLYISPSCVNTRREFGLYRRKRDPRNRERVLDDIEDKNNHAMDALRYAIQSHFGGADRSIREGVR